MGKSAVAASVYLACLLASASACLAQSDLGKAAQAPEPSQDHAFDGTRPNYRADDRIMVEIPEGPVRLAQSLSVPIRFTGGKILRIGVTESLPDHSFLSNEKKDTPTGDLETRILQSTEDSRTIEVIPFQVGEVEISILAAFEDGGIAVKDFPIQVVPCAIGLTKFTLLHSFPGMPIVLVDREEERQQMLTPEVRYESLKYPIYLHNSEQLKLSVSQPGEQPVIEVNKYGLVQGLSPGRAVITGWFDGVQAKITVIVYSKENAPVR